MAGGRLLGGWQGWWWWSPLYLGLKRFADKACSATGRRLRLCRLWCTLPARVNMPLITPPTNPPPSSTPPSSPVSFDYDRVKEPIKQRTSFTMAVMVGSSVLLKVKVIKVEIESCLSQQEEVSFPCMSSFGSHLYFSPPLYRSFVLLHLTGHILCMR